MYQSLRIISLILQFLEKYRVYFFLVVSYFKTNIVYIQRRRFRYDSKFGQNDKNRNGAVEAPRL